MHLNNYMRKIKLDLLEKLIIGTLLPFYGGLIAFIMLIITLVGKEYKNLKIILVLFVLSIFLLLISFGIIVLFEKHNKNQIELYDDHMIIKFRGNCEKYSYNDIKVNYYSCKWYMIPLVPIIKKGNAGIIEIRNLQGKLFRARILYHDFRKLREMIDNRNISLLKD